MIRLMCAATSMCCETASSGKPVMYLPYLGGKG
ncbi:MAG: hypothetical protein RI964_2776 [Pseudomonadota bacterium]|jgi:mitochondrial fission protein ELM1